MSSFQAIALPVAFFFIAVLYSAVGHAGASSYLAAMALLNMAPETMKPTALILNIMVAIIASIHFYRAGCFSWQRFWPFALASIPMAFLGGLITLQSPMYKIILGLVLFYAAIRIFISSRSPGEPALRSHPLWMAFLIGAGIGLLSGITGVGGGIFLSPILLLSGWADARKTAGISAMFILSNSIAGLTGYLLHSPSVPSQIPFWAISVILGGIIGSRIGSRRLGNKWLRLLLAIVLLFASLKMLFIQG
jgi:uncharacterized protein